MDLHQLQLFLAVMESPSVTRAAESVRLSPGAVSLQLHKLANELHTELFVRNGKRLAPTPAAWRLAEQARALLRLTSQIKQEFEIDVSTDTRPFHFIHRRYDIDLSVGQAVAAIAQAISERGDSYQRQSHRRNRRRFAKPSF